MPETPPIDGIYTLLDAITRHDAAAERLADEIAERLRRREREEESLADAVKAVTPYFMRIPEDTVIELLGTAFWYDPACGLCYGPLKPWTHLLPDEDDEHSPAQADPKPVVWCHACGAGASVHAMIGHDCLVCRNGTYSLAYRPIALTPQQETDAARRAAFEAAMMTDPEDGTEQAEVEAMAIEMDAEIDRRLAAIRNGDGQITGVTTTY